MANEVSRIYSDIAELLNIARAKAYHSVNSIMVETYWKIGQRIVEEEQNGSSRAEYGTKLIENLSKYLTNTFGKGFSEANLKNMRSFYTTYPEFDRQCLTNLSWSNVTRIIRIDNPEERNYYLNEAASQNWSYRQLERKNMDFSSNGFSMGNSQNIVVGSKLTLAGFPERGGEYEPDIRDMKVTRTKPISLVEHICVDTPIITGHSGGPIFNKRNEVVGIATRGSSYQDSDKTTNNAFITINMIEKHILK